MVVRSVIAMPPKPHLAESPIPLLEHARIRSVRAFPDAGVKMGEAGTIVHVYEEGGYEVEFLAGRARPAVVTVESDDVEAIVGDE